jgi:site-specific recombinase XerD
MKEKQTVDELVNEFENHLRTLQRGRYTLRGYWQIWKPLKLFMAAAGIEYYDRSVGDQFVKTKLGDYVYESLNQMQRHLVNKVDALHVFQQTGQIYFGIAPLRRNPPKVLAGEIGLAMQDFISCKSAIFSLAKSTKNHYLNTLHELLTFLNNKEVMRISEISEVYLVSFMKSLNPATLPRNHSKMGVIKTFFSYLYTENIAAKDYSEVIQRTNYKSQPRLPSFFSAEDIACILEKIDRGNPAGKRDYVFVLLAAKLGLRVSDIALLKFENINWDKGIIEIVQFKTKKEVTLPLLPEVGNAIIDYLKYGRPISNEPYCFIQHIYPFKPITPVDVTSKVAIHIRRSGIITKNRHKGAHALRHSFATQLLENKTPLPVISEALGHRRTATTMLYLRVDKQQLKQCALDVPMVAPVFYQQKGVFVA